MLCVMKQKVIHNKLNWILLKFLFLASSMSTMLIIISTQYSYWDSDNFWAVHLGICLVCYNNLPNMLCINSLMPLLIFIATLLEKIKDGWEGLVCSPIILCLCILTMWTWWIETNCPLDYCLFWLLNTLKLRLFKRD